MKYLQDITICTANNLARHREFNMSTNCVSIFFLSEIGRIPFGGVGKIIIEACPNLSSTEFDDLGEFITVKIKFNIDEFFKYSENEKRRVIFSLLRKGMLSACKYKQIKSDYIEKKLDELEGRIEHSVIHVGKSISNKIFTASIHVELYTDKAVVYLETRKKGIDNSVRKEVIRETEPHELCFNKYVPKIKWADENKISLTFSGLNSQNYKVLHLV